MAADDKTILEEVEILNGTAKLTVYNSGRSVLSNNGSPLASMNPPVVMTLDAEGRKIAKAVADRAQ